MGFFCSTIYFCPLPISFLTLKKRYTDVTSITFIPFSFTLTLVYHRNTQLKTPVYLFSDHIIHLNLPTPPLHLAIPSSPFFQPYITVSLYSYGLYVSSKPYYLPPSAFFIRLTSISISLNTKALGFVQL